MSLSGVLLDQNSFPQTLAEHLYMQAMTCCEIQRLEQVKYRCVLSYVSNAGTPRSQRISRRCVRTPLDPEISCGRFSVVATARETKNTIPHDHVEKRWFVFFSIVFFLETRTSGIEHLSATPCCFQVSISVHRASTARARDSSEGWLGGCGIHRHRFESAAFSAAPDNVEER